MGMNMQDLRRAGYVLDKIKELERLRDDLCEREVDFCDGDRRRSVGRNQLEESAAAEQRETMKRAGIGWINEKIDEKLTELQKLGVDTEDERPTSPPPSNSPTRYRQARGG